MTAAAAPDDRKKGHCPKCGPNRWALVKGEFEKTDHDDTEGVWASTTYRILQCPACESVYCQSDFVFSEDIDYGYHPVTGEQTGEYNHKIEHWPHSPENERRKPPWIDQIFIVDDDLYSLFSDVYTALGKDLSVLAAIGIRTVFDRASQLVGIDSNLSFQRKLSELLQQGKIGADQKDILDTLTDAGSAAAHRGWRPTTEQLATMMDAIESFLHSTFILGEAAKRLRSNIPSRNNSAPRTNR